MKNERTVRTNKNINKVASAKRKTTEKGNKTMITMMESTTTIDLSETTTPPPTSIEEIHIETIEERLHDLFLLLLLLLKVICF